MTERLTFHQAHLDLLTLGHQEYLIPSLSQFPLHQLSCFLCLKTRLYKSLPLVNTLGGCHDGETSLNPGVVFIVGLVKHTHTHTQTHTPRPTPHVPQTPRGPGGWGWVPEEDDHTAGCFKSTLCRPPERGLTRRQVWDQGEEGRQSWHWGGRARRGEEVREAREQTVEKREGLKESTRL